MSPLGSFAVGLAAIYLVALALGGTQETFFAALILLVLYNLAEFQWRRRKGKKGG